MEVQSLLKKGGVWYNVPGNTPRNCIMALSPRLPLPSGVAPEQFALACTRRELISSTAMGSALAFPHPSAPLFDKPEDSFTALVYPRFPIEWKAADGLPVRAFFVVALYSKTEHLLTLASLARLCTSENFHAALMDEAPLDTLLKLIP